MNTFPTAAVVLAQLDSWTELSERRRIDFKSTLRLLGRIYSLPLESIRLDPAEMAKTVLGTSHAAIGIKRSSLKGYQSSLRAILRRLNLIDVNSLAILTP